MSNVSDAIARVKAIHARVAEIAPPKTGEFQKALDEAVEGQKSTMFGAAQTKPKQAPYTIGNFVTGVWGVTPPHVIRRPPVDGVFTSSELADYLAETTVRDRNGRLTQGELVPISGGWGDRSGGLLEPAAVAWEMMREAAAVDGIDLQYVDAYRNWDVQHRAHQRFLSGEKKEHVLAAGTSEHGVGLAIDITNGSIIRKDDVEWEWMSVNGPAFGWWPISNESWHWEFRGT